MLVNRAALDRRVGPQRRQRLFQACGAPSASDQLPACLNPRLTEIVEQRAPGGLAFPAHACRIASSSFWPSARTPSATRKRDRGRLAVEADTDNRAVEDQPHDRRSPSGRAFQASQSPFTLRHARLTTSLPPARRTPRQRPPHPAGVGPGKIGPGDQRVGGLGAALVGAKRGAPPFARPAVLAHQSSARHGDPRLAERARQRPFAMPVAHAHDRRAAASSPDLRRP